MTIRTKRTSDSIFENNKTRIKNVKWTKNDVYGTERTSDSIFVKTHSGNTCGRQLGQLDDRADGGTSSGKCSKTVRTADSKSTTSDKALVSDEETAIVLAQPARFASEETMHGFRV